MRPIDDPSELTPDKRRAEVAQILAAGVLRLLARTSLVAKVAEFSAGENFEKSASPGLEVSDETVLSVHNG